MRPPQPVGPGRFRTGNGHRDETVPVSTTAAPPQPTRPARSGIPRGFAALIGVLAVGAALAAGQLVAGIISPASSPFLAVGDTVIRFSPQFLTEFAKTTFGTADKPVLLAGMAVVIAIVAAVAGLASRHRPTPGVAVIAVLGVVGILAVVFAPVFSPLDLVAPVVALATGIGVFRAAARTGARDRRPSGRGRPARPAVAALRADRLVGRGRGGVARGGRRWPAPRRVASATRGAR